MSTRQTVKNKEIVIGQITNVDKKANKQVGTVTVKCQEKGYVKLKIYLSQLKSKGNILEKNRWIKGVCKIRPNKQDLLRSFRYIPVPEHIPVKQSSVQIKC